MIQDCVNEFLFLSRLKLVAKFTEYGEIMVDVRLDGNSGVSPQAADAVPYRVRFDVRDTGIGISEDVLPRLFQAFSQADGSTHPQIWRDRSGSGDFQAIGQIDGRRDRRG
jgi:signal transduction histidine kinase